MALSAGSIPAESAIVVDRPCHVVHTCHMTTNQNTPTIPPLDNPECTTFNNLATSPNPETRQRAVAFDLALRGLIELGTGRKIYAIKILRNLVVSFGIDMGILEAKQTVDAMQNRMTVEILRDLLREGIDAPSYERHAERLRKINPTVASRFGM